MENYNEDNIYIGVSSSEEVRSKSYGEVKNDKTISFRTRKPIRDGLFCEVIFGPINDFRCACGRLKGHDYVGKVCERCGVELSKSNVRRERMGHIELASPVIHTVFLRNLPKMALLLDQEEKDLENIIDLKSYLVIESGSIGDLKKYQIITKELNKIYRLESSTYRSLTGAEAIKRLLQKINLKEEISNIQEHFNNAKYLKKEYYKKRLEVLEAFLDYDKKPEWIVLDVIPVFPPGLRDIVQTKSGHFVTITLNTIYQRIIRSNNRLRKQIDENIVEFITDGEKKLLQKNVDELIINDNNQIIKKIIL